MINQRVQDAINEQINAELYSAYLYLSMESYLEKNGLPGFANWMRIQFQEEQFHGLKFFDYVNERGGQVTLKPIAGPETSWDGVIAVFEEVAKHEAHVTSLINNLMSIAIEEKDYAATNFLQWYVDEQVEEEATAATILDQLRMIGGEGHGMLMLDREMAARTFTAPAE